MNKKFLFLCSLFFVVSFLPAVSHAETYTDGEECSTLGETRLATGAKDLIACLNNDAGTGKVWKSMTGSSGGVKKTRVGSLTVNAATSTSWTISGLEIGVPVLITLGGAYQGVVISTLSGSDDFLNSQLTASAGYTLMPLFTETVKSTATANMPDYLSHESSASMMLIPTATTLVMHVKGVSVGTLWGTKTNTLYAYQ